MAADGPLPQWLKEALNAPRINFDGEDLDDQLSSIAEGIATAVYPKGPLAEWTESCAWIGEALEMSANRDSPGHKLQMAIGAVTMLNGLLASEGFEVAEITVRSLNAGAA